MNEGRNSGPSPALIEANRRLCELREISRRGVAGTRGLSVHLTGDGRPVTADRRPTEDEGRRTNSADHRPLTTNYQPLITLHHLGWHSPAVTVAVRAVHALADRRPTTDDQRPTTADQQPATNHKPQTTNHLPPSQNRISKIENRKLKLFPSLALAMLGQDQAAAGRIWLLLRYLDQDGRGWLDVGMVRDELTGKESELRVCGWRQLRNLLGQGGGVFWQRDRDRLWLYSAARVSAALGIDRLSGRPVALPVKSLLGGIGRVRAHFYASFHSGREDESTGARPISRATLRQITHVPQRTQRLYERTAGIRVRSNIAVGQRLTEQTIQERAWRQGRAVFAFNDRRGQQGTAGGRYVAWRLPNSYQGCHAQSPPGRQKKINRQIDLVNLGAQGNELPGEIQKDHTGFQGDKPKLPVVINPLRSDEKNYRESAVFHSNGQSAGKAYNRNSAADAYWPQLRDRAYRPRLWHIIARAPTKNDTFSKTRHFSRGVS